jgi:hypothetical protein
MIDQTVIQDIKVQSLVIWETLTKSIPYKVTEITLDYSETIDLIISSNLNGIVIGIYVDEEGSHPCIATTHLEYRDNEWIDENE